TGQTFWSLQYLKDDDVAVSPAALAGSDLWMCPGVEGRIFMSNRVVEALKAALSDADFADFELHRCRVVGWLERWAWRITGLFRKSFRSWRAARAGPRSRT